jgi:hypothetical protein
MNIYQFANGEPPAVDIKLPTLRFGSAFVSGFALNTNPDAFF